MDNHERAANFGDVDIVENTQFTSDNCNGSEVPSTPEARFLYDPSQSSTYSQYPYVPYPGMRPTALNLSQGSMCPSISQIRPAQMHVWPSYGGGVGAGGPPMMHMFGSGFYQTGNFNGMSLVYGGLTHAGAADDFIRSQAVQFGGAPRNGHWSGTRNMNPTMTEQFQRSMMFAEGNRPHDRHCLPNDPPTDRGEQWLCPRSKQSVHEGPDRCIQVQVQDQADKPSGTRQQYDDQGNRGITRGQTSELRHSPPPNSAETQQGPHPCASAQFVKTGRASKEQIPQNLTRAATQSHSGIHGDVTDSSKSRTSKHLNKRKILREDNILYSKEVKSAISQGRVPQVAIVQDDNGNIVRFKTQFLNALKLAAHAIVQDAYINVKDKDTMNEVMWEVKRQFKIPRPLPTGMVENYLKGYFKRLRSQYHQFWSIHGSGKRPDDCKQAVWLQLIEYWKSPEGTKECQQNKVNATPRRKESDKCKENDGGDCTLEPYDMGSKDAENSASKHSDSLGFLDGTPMTTTTPSSQQTRNPMVDISNQLHDAVDSILLSFAEKCGSLPSLNVNPLDTRKSGLLHAGESVKTFRGITRTTEEVLDSLKRPEVPQQKNEVPLNECTSAGGRSHIHENSNYNFEIRSNEIVGRQRHGKSASKGLINDTSGTVKALFSKSVGDGRGKEHKDGNIDNVDVKCKQQALVLLSDASSDGVDISEFTCEKKKCPDNVFNKCKGGYTEEIDGWKPTASDKGKAVSRSFKVSGIESFPIIRLSEAEQLKKAKAKSSSRKANVDVSSDAETNEVFEEEDRLPSDMLEETDDEEPPVLPREIAKRKLDGNYCASVGNTQTNTRQYKRTSRAALKKQKVTQIDASLIKKLEFYKRPKNSKPIKNRIRVWVLHPKYPGKVVAEAHAGVNRKSRCVDSANEMCKEGQQMISVVRLTYKNIPVMYDSKCRFPNHIQYLDQAEGLPHTTVLWCVCHIIEIPPLDQITRLLGDFIQPLSQETVNSASDFEDSRSKRKTNAQAGICKETRRGRLTSDPEPTANASKVSKSGRRS